MSRKAHGRPVEPETLASFPHPTGFGNGTYEQRRLREAVRLMQGVHGAIGYCFCFKVLEWAFGCPGCVLELTPVTRRVLAHLIGVRGDKFDRLLVASFALGLFDETAYRERGVLTNRYIQRTATSTFNRREGARRRWERRHDESENAS